jgi:hypothetical protein
MTGDSITNTVSRIYGWYDSPHQPVDKPTYNPPLDSPCPHCDKPLTDGDMRTHSMMMEKAVQAFFFRTHKTCDELATPEERQVVDDKIWDLIVHDRIVEFKP